MTFLCLKWYLTCFCSMPKIWFKLVPFLLSTVSIVNQIVVFIPTIVTISFLFLCSHLLLQTLCCVSLHFICGEFTIVTGIVVLLIGFIFKLMVLCSVVTNSICSVVTSILCSIVCTLSACLIATSCKCLIYWLMLTILIFLLVIIVTVYLKGYQNFKFCYQNCYVLEVVVWLYCTHLYFWCQINHWLISYWYWLFLQTYQLDCLLSS